MQIPEYTLVVGVDKKHLKQLEWVYPTWKRHKPTMVQNPMVIFFDRFQLTEDDVLEVIGERKLLAICPWPPEEACYKRSPDEPETRFNEPQRYKMLAGFVHVPAMTVTTPYWLKLDTDVVATGSDDWVKPYWFKSNPAIIAHAWSFTKPANQIDQLDEWVEQYKDQLPLLAHNLPLNMHPQPGSERIGHRRIISWCGFFSTAVTRLASSWASHTCGVGQLPVPSQDGYLWYVATRLQQDIIRTSMKEANFQWWATETNVRNAVKEAMKSG